jgi:hypothetical protein
VKLSRKSSSEAPKVPRPRPPKPAGAWKLFRAAMAELRRHWKPYVLVMAIVAVPLDLVLLIPGVSTDPSAQAITNFAVITMNIALIWAIVQQERTGKAPRPSVAYYSGSEALIRTVLTMAALVLMLIPAAFAAVIYILGAVTAQAVGTLPEEILILFVSVLIAMISVWWLVRFGLAPIIAVAEGLTPIHALRYSRRLTLGRFWRVFSRYAALIFFIFLSALPIALITAGISAIHLAPIATLFFELVTTFTALPLLNIYLLRLYRNLDKGYQTIAPEEDPEAEPKPSLIDREA